ncbi:MAG TPA: DUF6522 family protein [Paracoccaceae bacterium]|nr:DUF6522 family protein [Paracoccaceae bacterium]
MRIDMTDDGPVVPATELGPLLGVPPADLPRLMREGIVTARHEAGVDEDAGRFRLSFRYGDRLVRLTCTDDGTVVSRIRVSGTAPGADGA